MQVCTLSGTAARHKPWLSPTEQAGSAVAEMCVQLHTSVEEAAVRFYAQLRRRSVLS
jgi:hypothetical protein